jgi:hypothetical protein
VLKFLSSGNEILYSRLLTLSLRTVKVLTWRKLTNVRSLEIRIQLFIYIRILFILFRIRIHATVVLIFGSAAAVPASTG